MRFSELRFAELRFSEPRFSENCLTCSHSHLRTFLLVRACAYLSTPARLPVPTFVLPFPPSPFAPSPPLTCPLSHLCLFPLSHFTFPPAHFPTSLSHLRTFPRYVRTFPLSHVRTFSPCSAPVAMVGSPCTSSSKAVRHPSRKREILSKTPAGSSPAVLACRVKGPISAQNLAEPAALRQGTW